MELKKLIAESEKVRVYEADGRCVKVFKDPDEPKSVVLYEALTHTRVEETGFARIPQFEGITKIDGQWAVIYEHIPGKTFEQLMRENPAEADGYLGKMADLQIEVNSLHSAKISRLTDYLKRSIEGLDMIDDVKKYDLLTRLEAMPKHIKLCHGDLSPDNIIAGEDGAFIVDWLKAKQGNAAADVARTYFNFCLKHHTEWGERYLKIYCNKTGTPVNYVHDWLPIVAAAQLKFRRPEQRELLLTWIDIADYR
ncbi:MAG: aminoglycoside phosphotransferase family protein [Lachnospiraceae bacterium]|nr:aminoglycoside phosphotransferase family protein [Ruminococcus sp.]MCM1275516.1 aminoglycoside phosphotransferase family protein [Lachnospiraceae bacterium]